MFKKTNIEMYKEKIANIKIEREKLDQKERKYRIILKNKLKER